MYFNAHLLILPVLFAMSGVLAQQTASPTSGTPAVTYPADTIDAFVFCSSQDCTGTCEIVDGEYLTGTEDDGEAAPNDMGFQSIYWYDPNNSPLVLYTCVDYYNSDGAVSIGPNTCYNLYDNGVATDFGWYWYVAAPGY